MRNGQEKLTREKNKKNGQIKMKNAVYIWLKTAWIEQ